jgi:hypothetical protein
MQNIKYVSVKSQFKQKGCQVISQFLLTDLFNPIRVTIVDILAIKRTISQMNQENTKVDKKALIMF